MELCESNEALNQELHAAKVHISAQADEKEHMLRAAAAQVQQLAERAMALEDSEAQKNQANESLALMSAKMDEMEDKVAAQEKTLAQANARYEQAQTKLDKLEGKAGSFEHISGVVKDQNESLAKELSALRRQVCVCVLLRGGGGGVNGALVCVICVAKISAGGGARVSASKHAGRVEDGENYEQNESGRCVRRSCPRSGGD
jgi:uncharacterized coiled-coil protein SlyX